MNTVGNKNIYLVGIKGVGMAALAVYLKEQGHMVWGSDVDDNFPTDRILTENAIRVLSGFDKRHITDDIDIVITTGAHGGLANVETEEAKNKKISVMTLAQYVGIETKKYKTVIAVCGTHGKTTTSAMAAFVLHRLSLNASHLVGASAFSDLAGGHFGGYDFLVVEADEYVASVGIDDTPRFMYLSPSIIMCTNIDFDHPDVYPDINAIQEAYRLFFNRLDPKTGTLIYFQDNALLYKTATTLAIKHKAPYTNPARKIMLKLPGHHNQQNAESIIKLASILGLEVVSVETALSEFAGVERRFEKIYEENGIMLYDDYAHHPVEIEATIGAFQDQYHGRRLLVFFQPHTYSRTAALHTAFVHALHHADKAYITDIFASAREDGAGITAQELQGEAQALGYHNVAYCPINKISQIVQAEARSGDIVITMGAGALYEAHNDIINVIKHLS